VLRAATFTWRWWRTSPASTTWSCALFARATPGSCSACRRFGTSRPPIARATVIEPHTVLEEFGVDIADETQINVWDSSADLRYMVLPERPAGTEGWAEERLAALVSREAMIGAAVSQSPKRSGHERR
jgi:Nitrile hydratase, alpha chain